VPEHDLDYDTLDHLRDEGLVETVDLGYNERGLTLTREGRDLLDLHSLARIDIGRRDLVGLSSIESFEFVYEDVHLGSTRPVAKIAGTRRRLPAKISRGLIRFAWWAHPDQVLPGS
jgi:hypothetical protein